MQLCVPTFALIVPPDDAAQQDGTHGSSETPATSSATSLADGSEPAEVNGDATAASVEDTPHSPAAAPLAEEPTEAHNDSNGAKTSSADGTTKADAATTSTDDAAVASNADSSKDAALSSREQNGKHIEGTSGEGMTTQQLEEQMAELEALVLGDDDDDALDADDDDADEASPIDSNVGGAGGGGGDAGGEAAKTAQ